MTNADDPDDTDQLAAPPLAAARLDWQGRAFIPADLAEQLMGAGARYELVDDDVLGHRMEVFVRRPRNLREVLARAVDAHPDDPLLVAEDRRWTFAEVAADVDALGRLLIDRYGIEPGDRVAIVSANSAEYGLLMWAVVAVGAIVVSLNGWWTGPELAHGVSMSEPKLIAGDDRRLERLPAGAVGAAVPVRRLADLVAEARALASPAPPGVVVDEDDPAIILFTSGTTGRPKGATLSHRNIINFGEVAGLSAEIGKALLPVDGPPRPGASILASPMFHVSGIIGMLMSGPVMGMKLVFPPPGRWDATRHLELTVEHGISAWSGVPTQFFRLLHHPDLDRYDVSTLRTVGGGGAPFAPELVRELHARFPSVSLGNGYGMSETVGLGTLAAGPVMTMAPDSVGPCQATNQVEIRDERGTVVGEGEVGEIYLRSPSVFLGYWGDDAATAACLDGDRWYRTGDFGRVRGGMLYLESRARDLIIRGGENIYPLEIEHRLAAHPDIDDAAVIGVDHDELGQEVKAFVVLRPGTALSDADVQRWAAGALAAFKVPAQVEFRDALPYTDTGKVLKQQLEREEREERDEAAQ